MQLRLAICKDTRNQTINSRYSTTVSLKRQEAQPYILCTHLCYLLSLTHIGHQASSFNRFSFQKSSKVHNSIKPLSCMLSFNLHIFSPKIKEYIRDQVQHVVIQSTKVCKTQGVKSKESKALNTNSSRVVNMNSIPPSLPYPTPYISEYQVLISLSITLIHVFLGLPIPLQSHHFAIIQALYLVHHLICVSYVETTSEDAYSSCSQQMQPLLPN